MTVHQLHEMLGDLDDTRELVLEAPHGRRRPRRPARARLALRRPGRPTGALELAAPRRGRGVRDATARWPTRPTPLRTRCGPPPPAGCAPA